MPFTSAGRKEIEALSLPAGTTGSQASKGTLMTNNLRSDTTGDAANARPPLTVPEMALEELLVTLVETNNGGDNRVIGIPNLPRFWRAFDRAHSALLHEWAEEDDENI